MESVSNDKLFIAKSLLKRLLYFDIFSHPLLLNELIELSDIPNLKVDEGAEVLEAIKNKKLINFESGYYYLGNDPGKIEKRKEANNFALLRMKDARKFSWIISKFPFVKAIFISGSLSKDVMWPDSDIDFFIITQTGRLWLCRAFLTIFKKIFLLGSRRNFCLNYFIDSKSLEIPDKNIFTATEIAFLLPMYNYPLYLQFLQANTWYRREYPNFKERPEDNIIKKARFGKVIEYILNNRLGDKLDQWSFNIITKYWHKKFRHFNEQQFAISLRSLKNVSKHHPNDYQPSVLTQYSQKIRTFEEMTKFSLSFSPKKGLVFEWA